MNAERPAVPEPAAVWRPAADGLKRLWGRAWWTKALLGLGLLIILGLTYYVGLRLVEWGDTDLARFHGYGRAVIEDRPLYRERWSGGEYLYPPFFALALTALAWLPVGLFAFLWGLVNLAATALALLFALALAEPLRHRRGRRSILLWLLALSWAFWNKNLTAGQLNAVLLLLVLAGVHQLERGHDAGAGLLLGLATALKLTPGLLLVYLLLRGRWRVILWAMGIFLVLNLVVPLVVWGPERLFGEYAVYLECLSRSFLGAVSVHTWYDNQAPAALLTRLSAAADFSLEASRVAVVTEPLVVWGRRILALLLVGGTVAALWKRPGGYRGRLIDYALLAALPLALTATTWKHHYLGLVPALLLLVLYWWEDSAGRGPLTVLVVLGLGVNLLALGDILPGALIGEAARPLRYAHFFYPFVAYLLAVYGWLLTRRWSSLSTSGPPPSPSDPTLPQGVEDA